MKKPLTAFQIEELHHSKEWCNTIVRFMDLKESAIVFQEVLTIIDNVFKENNLKSMKMVVREVNEWAHALSKKDFDELNILLTKKFKTNLVLDSKNQSSLVKLILKRGKIKNADEFRMIERQLDLANDDFSEYEIRMLDHLMGKFVPDPTD